jgi:hypothetical protein
MMYMRLIHKGGTGTMLHMIYPENRAVSEDTVIGWAFDELVNNAYAALPQEEKEKEDAIEKIMASTPHPTLEDSIYILEDNGSVTFSRTSHIHPTFTRFEEEN